MPPKGIGNGGKNMLSSDQKGKIQKDKSNRKGKGCIVLMGWKWKLQGERDFLKRDRAQTPY